MLKTREIDKDKLETTKQDFETLLKKACGQKPKPSPKLLSARRWLFTCSLQVLSKLIQS